MKKNQLLLLLAVFFLSFSAVAQVIPVTLEERVQHCKYIAIGQIKEQHGYWDLLHQRINTLNTFEVRAFLKGSNHQSSIGMITEGGVVNDELVGVCPGDDIHQGQDYLFFLKEEERQWDDRSARIESPLLIQAQPYYVLAVLPYEKGKYIDLFGNFTYSEEELLKILKDKYRLEATTPNGEPYMARSYTPENLGSFRTISSITDRAGNAATALVAGTIVANNEMIINGSGFGTTPGSVAFRDANDAGTSSIVVSSSDLLSGTEILANGTDLLSWTDTKIELKIPRRAGTGNVEVFSTGGTSVGLFSITVDWAEICRNAATITSCGPAVYGANVRHRIELANMDALGGYSFLYNDGSSAAPGAAFSTTTVAQDAFARAVNTWRCASLPNIKISPTPTSIGFVNNDAKSVVLFDATLSANALGICSWYAAGTCNQSCTSGGRYYISDMDIRIVPAFTGTTTWNYTVAAPSSTQFDFESVMLHEIGHGLGLGHVIDNNKLMHYTINKGVAKRTLAGSDIAASTFRNAHSSAAQCVGNAMTLLTVATCAILPIEIIDFKGTVQKQTISLEWETASERSNDFFILEHSINGIDFQAIGKVRGAGFSETEQKYSFNHLTPINGINYYRLKQTDFDSKTEIVKTITVLYVSNFIQFEVFNQSINQQVRVIYQNENSQGAILLQLFDMSGRQLQQATIPTIDTRLDYPLDTASLPQGMYFIRLQDGDIVRNQHFIK